MVRMGRGETMSPGVLTWAMDQVAERYAQQDGQTLQSAGIAGPMACSCSVMLAQNLVNPSSSAVHAFSTAWCRPRFRLCL